MLGPNRLPDAGGAVGHGLREFRSSIRSAADAPARLDPSPNARQEEAMGAGHLELTGQGVMLRSSARFRRDVPVLSAGPSQATAATHRRQRAGADDGQRDDQQVQDGAQEGRSEQRPHT